jgi:hypothetical protein
MVHYAARMTASAANISAADHAKHVVLLDERRKVERKRTPRINPPHAYRFCPAPTGLDFGCVSEFGLACLAAVSAG